MDAKYLDCNKAFNTLSHIKVWMVELLHGQKKRVEDWTQRIMVNELYSAWRLVTSEIPQGSVLRLKYLTKIKHHSL